MTKLTTIGKMDIISPTEVGMSDHYDDSTPEQLKAEREASERSQEFFKLKDELVDCPLVLLTLGELNLTKKEHYRHGQHRITLEDIQKLKEIKERFLSFDQFLKKAHSALSPKTDGT